MMRLVLDGAVANEAATRTGEAVAGRSVAVLFTIVVAVAAYGTLSVLMRVLRQAVAISMKLLAAVVTAAAIGILAIVVIGALLLGFPSDAAAGVVAGSTGLGA